MREAARTGVDLQAQRRAVRTTADAAPPAVPTFSTFAEACWKNPVHRQQWRSTLCNLAKQLQSILIDAMVTDDVIAALTPIWTSKPETAKRVQGRIEKILDAAKSRAFDPAMHLIPLRGVAISRCCFHANPS